LNVDDVNELVECGEPFGHGQPGLDALGEPPAGEPPLEDFGDALAEKALGLTLRSFFGPSPEPGFDDLGDSVEGGIDDFGERGLLNLLELGLSPSAEAGLFVSFTIFPIASHVYSTGF